jgi:Asp-tRNA(Asn)/Glu-tRNA(Gln) amidotransferase C subunit
VAETLRRSLYLRPALEKLIAIERHNTAKSARLKRFKLKKDEWELLTQLEPILLVISCVLQSQILTVCLLAFFEGD